VIPLLSGGGSPLKFVEALAYGSAIVATPAAARGIEAQAGRDYLEAADPQGFAAAVASVLRGERPDLRRSARELAEDRYSIESLRARLG
jgi:glycosyltransferase involved in cell wall biosynthesis